MQANRKVPLCSRKKPPIYMLSRSKAPEHSKFRVTNIRETSVGLFYGTALASTLAPKIILLA